MVQFHSEVISCRETARDYYELTFTWKGPVPQPGQFLTLRCWDGDNPLLRRPFALSAYDAAEKRASLIFQKRGPATTLMTRLKTGDHIDILGPLGGVFPAPAEGLRPVIVGGGIGTGPVLFLAEALSRAGLRPLLVLGFRDKAYVPRVHLPTGCETVICTDDGSTGFKGNVIDYLRTRKDELAKAAFYGCGPHPMLKGLHELALETDSPCFVSVEEVMACGIGACQGCAVPVELPQKFLRVCQDGPVFDSRIMKWT
ncbi:MAG: dihydroorotate dehydrogenase electron transfer subunit [Spirochaetales bacterium]|nr:dihydroorotate dehydrogenase electron transfer subunit [Spirochaetales bacterium]